VTDAYRAPAAREPPAAAKPQAAAPRQAHAAAASSASVGYSGPGEEAQRPTAENQAEGDSSPRRPQQSYTAVLERS
jgi:hypothetical protein